MGWPGERQRHAMSARGITTISSEIKKTSSTLITTKGQAEKLIKQHFLENPKIEDVWVSIDDKGVIDVELKLRNPIKITHKDKILSPIEISWEHDIDFVDSYYDVLNNTASDFIYNLSKPPTDDEIEAVGNEWEWIEVNYPGKFKKLEKQATEKINKEYEISQWVYAEYETNLHNIVRQYFDKKGARHINPIDTNEVDNNKLIVETIGTKFNSQYINQITDEVEAIT